MEGGLGDLEWDEDKRQRVLVLRGLDFADVARFDLGSLVTKPDLRRDYGELRFNTTGYLDGRLCTFCWTPRGSRTRIISMRKSNERECQEYERAR